MTEAQDPENSRQSVPTIRETLVETLTKIGKPTEVFQSPDGSAALILPYGGRILGLFSPSSQQNFYWTHPALESPESARAFYAGEQWHNSGGDRTWLAPEVDFFFPEFPRLEPYWQPRALDPGDYRVVRHGNRLELVNQLTATLSRAKQQVEMKITKAVAPALNPLRHEPLFDEIRGVAYAGYTLHTHLALTGGSGSNSAQVGLWNLVQMPHGGELLVPTYLRAQVKIYMGTVRPEDLAISDHLLCYRMRAAGEHKIGVRATASTGRAGYLYPAGKQYALVIRNFFVNPSGEYVDVPWKEPANYGFSTQACNINSDLGRFSELEYHVSAIGQGTGLHECHDVSQIWAFRGTRKEIQLVVRSILSSED